LASGFLFLAIFTYFEALSIVLCDLSLPKLQARRHGSTFALVSFSAKLSTSFTVLIDGFVKAMRLNFFKSRSTLLRQAQTPTCHFTTSTCVLASLFNVSASSAVHAAEASFFFFFFYLGTFVSRFVLVPLYFLVPVLDYDNASSTSTSFLLLLLFLSGDSDRFTLICTIFASIIALCGSLRGPNHLFDSFPNLYLYFSLLYFFMGLLLGSPPLFCL